MMTDDDIRAGAIVACPCGETGHPREQCDPSWLAEVDAAYELLGDSGVPDVASGGALCWACRTLVVHGIGPHSEWARRCDRVLSTNTKEKTMTGYNWTKGKSNNAVAAERDGKLVASKFASWVRRWKRFKGCTALDVGQSLVAVEWHHSSKFYNIVNYYDPMDMADHTNRLRLAASIRRRKEFQSLLKKHCDENGRFVILTPEGEYWYTIGKEDCYNIYALDRMKATIAQMERA